MKFPHVAGALIALAIIVLGLIWNPFKTSAEEMHWGFKKAVNEQPAEAGSAFDQVLKKHGAVYKGSPKEKVVYVTFDNGFEAGYTKSILDTLKKEDVPATFFLTGHYVKSAPDLVKQMIKDGHTIGNHSFGHPNMARLSKEEMKKEWQSFDQLLNKTVGVKRTHYVRPPEGVFNETVLAYGNELGYRHVFWSVAFVDWQTKNPRGKDYSYNELMKQLHPGAIILMHTVIPDNAKALPDFIQEAKKKGYVFKSLDSLFEQSLSYPSQT